MNGTTTSGASIKRYILTSLTSQITLNHINTAVFIVTNCNWRIGNTFSLTFFQLTSQDNGTVYKTVLAGSDIYSLTKVDDSHYTLSDNSGYPGAPGEIVIDLYGSISAIS